MNVTSIFNRRSAGGQRIRLYNGETVQVAALSWDAVDRVMETKELWDELWKHVAPTPTAASNSEFLRNLGAAILSWRQLVVLILEDSNPGLDVDLDWCRENLKVRDVAAILAAAIEENGLGPWWAGVWLKVREAGDLMINAGFEQIGAK